MLASHLFISYPSQMESERPESKQTLCAICPKREGFAKIIGKLGLAKNHGCAGPQEILTGFKIIDPHQEKIPIPYKDGSIDDVLVDNEPGTICVRTSIICPKDTPANYESILVDYETTVGEPFKTQKEQRDELIRGVLEAFSQVNR